MAKKKPELFQEITTEMSFENVLDLYQDKLICAEIYCGFVGPCAALHRFFTTVKFEWSNDHIVLLKVLADEIEVLSRFRQQSQPVYMFIVEFLNARMAEKQLEASSLAARRARRQEARKRHRAQLMVPHLQQLNFVLYWPHAARAHPALYERWNVNNIIMVGREEIDLTEEQTLDVLYGGDAPLNEASLHSLRSGPALAICFRLLDDDKQFVSLVRKILYEDIPPLDDAKPTKDQPPQKTAFDYYSHYSPSREQIWQKRREEKTRRREEAMEQKARGLSEMQRLARQAIEEAIEAKKKAKEDLKMQLLKAGNLAALDELKAQSDDGDVGIEVPEELSEDSEESSLEEDEDEYFPPGGLLVPGLYAPPNDVAKVNGLAILFPKLTRERVRPPPERLPPHVLVMLPITRRHLAVKAMAKYTSHILHMGVFKATTPHDAVHVAYTVRQYDAMNLPVHNIDDLRLAFMVSISVDRALLQLMDLGPVYVSRDAAAGEDDCAAMFSVSYGDHYPVFEDFANVNV